MPGTAPKTRVLIVNDDPEALTQMREAIGGRAQDLAFVFSDGGETALEALRHGHYAVVVSDMDNRHLGGPDFLTAVRDEMPSVVRIVLSANTEAARLHHLADDDGFYLRKGCSLDEFLDAVRDAAEMHKWFSATPPPPTAEDLLAILVDYFKREIIHQKLSLRDLPDGIKPYISRELLLTADHDHAGPDPAGELEPDPESPAWLDGQSWTDRA